MEEEEMRKLEEEITKKMELRNITPLPDLDNLSPTDMHQLLYLTFGETSPVGFKEEISLEILDQIPFLNLLIEFLEKVETAGEIKLTKRENLPKKMCLDLYAKGFIKEEPIELGIVKLSKEADSITIQNVKIISFLCGLIKKRNNKISLTATGKKLIKREHKKQLLKKVFLINCQKFNMGFHDGYPHSVGIQATFGFTIYLLLRHGNEERKLDYYADKGIKAFPFILDKLGDKWSTPESDYKGILNIRVFVRFLNYYGFLDYKSEIIPRQIDKKVSLKTTELFKSIFEIRNEKFSFRKSKYSA